MPLRSLYDLASSLKENRIFKSFATGQDVTAGNVDAYSGAPKKSRSEGLITPVQSSLNCSAESRTESTNRSNTKVEGWSADTGTRWVSKGGNRLAQISRRKKAVTNPRASLDRINSNQTQNTMTYEYTLITNKLQINENVKVRNGFRVLMKVEQSVIVGRCNSLHALTKRRRGCWRMHSSD